MLELARLDKVFPIHADLAARKKPNFKADDERVYYITMELLDGITLSKLLSKGTPLPPMRAVNIAMQMCRSLREAHAEGPECQGNGQHDAGAVGNQRLIQRARTIG